jgi:hypothetical protein
VLDAHGVYRFMPVQTGFGSKTLDYLCCHNGRFFSIETKAPGKSPTKLQIVTGLAIIRAGGMVFVIDGDTSGLEEWLKEHDPDQPKAPTGGGAANAAGSQLVSGSEDNALRGYNPYPPAAPPNGDVPPEKAGVRRSKPYPHTLRLVRGEPVQVPEGNVRAIDSRTKGLRPKRNGDG